MNSRAKGLTALLALCFAASASGQQPQIWRLQGVDKEQTLYLEHADGISIRFRWSTVNPAPGLYDWSYVRRQIQRAQGKPFALRIMAGVNAPAWAVDAWIPKAQTGIGVPIPDPRTPHHRDAMDLVLREMRAEFPGPACVFVPSFGKSAEMNAPKGGGASFAAPFIERVSLLSDLYGPTRVCINISRPDDPWVERALTLSAGLGVAASMNSLKADTNSKQYHAVIAWPNRIGWQFSGTAARAGDTATAYAKSIATGRTAWFYECYPPPQISTMRDLVGEPDPFEQAVSEAVEAANAAIDAALEQLPPERRSEARAEVVRRLGG